MRLKDWNLKEEGKDRLMHLGYESVVFLNLKKKIERLSVFYKYCEWKWVVCV